MKIVDISVDGFGVWRDLELAELSDKVTVFYGPNEAGKTTLMNFIRAVLYGCKPEQGRRYLPPLRGGEPGGRLVIDAAKGRFTLARHQFEGVDRVVLTTADGQSTHRGALLDLLAGCDETIFRNVYAIGLREIQELGTLSDTEASRHLYDLSVGLDRVSLPDVMRELQTARGQLLSDGEVPSRIGQLVRRREELSLQLEQNTQHYHEFLRLADQQTQLDQSIANTEQRRQDLDRDARQAELAYTLHDKWLERDTVQEEIDRLGDVPTLPDDAVEKLDQLNESIDEHQRARVALKTERQRHRDEAAALAINERLSREAPRIEALGLQRDWIASLETEINALDADAAQLEANVSAARQEVGLGSYNPSSLSSEALDRLRKPARVLRETRERRARQQSQNEQHEEEVRRLNREIETKLASHGATSLDDALERAGNQAAELRRRIQLDDRLEQLELHESDLEEQSHALLERQQIMPTRLLMGIGAGVVLGVLLILVGLFMPVAWSIGIVLAPLGLACLAVAIGAKFVLEKTAARDLEQCQQQLALISEQRQQLTEEREQLDRTLPKSGGPLAVRLQAAEKKVAELEQILPLDSQRDLAQQQIDAGSLQLQQASDEYRDARDKWTRALSNLGLPTDLSPRQVKDFAARGAEVGRMHERFEGQRLQADERRRHLASCAQRVAELTRALQLPNMGHSTIERLDALLLALDQQQQHLTHRDALQEKARLARRKQLRHAASVEKLSTRRQRLLDRAGVSSSADYRKMALASTRKTLLIRQRDQLSSEITTALSGVCEESALAEQFVDKTTVELEKRWENFGEQVEQADVRLKELFQQRGNLEAQAARYREDRQAMETQFELGCVEQQLKEATSRWQELALTSQVLERICRRYERDQQPATLKEASRYLNQMTEGHYRRVWTPLGENRLIVDDANGNPLSPEVLSRGTREQLFLSLRLALASLYVQRGVRLPLVLDDVLVNFDSTRAKAAAKVLREFAAAGHQVLIFTCHEHMVKMFKSLRVDTRTLPDNSAAVQLTVTPEPEKVEKPKRTRKKAKPKKQPEPVEEPIEIEEPVAADEELELEPLPAEPPVEAPVEEPVVVVEEEPVDLTAAVEYDEADWEEVDEEEWEEEELEEDDSVPAEELAAEEDTAEDAEEYDEEEYEVEEDEYEDDEYEDEEEVDDEQDEEEELEAAEYDEEEDAEYDEGEELEYEEDEYEEAELEEDDATEGEDDEDAESEEYETDELEEDEYEEYEEDEYEDDEDDRDAEAA